MNKFLNPYDRKNLTPDEIESAKRAGVDPICRTTIELPRSVHAHIMGTFGKTGALQTTINLLVSKLYAELTKHGIGPTYDAERFAQAVGDATIIIGHLDGDIAFVAGGLQRIPLAFTTDEQEHPVPVETINRDVGLGTSGVAQSSKDAQQPADIGSTRPSKRGSKSSKGGKK